MGALVHLIGALCVVLMVGPSVLDLDQVLACVLQGAPALACSATAAEPVAGCSIHRC